jgi:ketosteroid isomerase-like protein
MPVDEGGTDVAAAVRVNYESQRQAMVAGDADALGALLADDFTLTHMTGYLQPKAKWLADVRSGEMTYHVIEDVVVAVDVSGDTPVVTARTRTEATIWGSHGTWPLELTIHFSHVGVSWMASHTVASSWR